MEQRTEQAIEEIKARFLTLLSPFEGKVTYGNLRHEITDWQEGDRKVTNFAIVYETPGGSTNQLNVTYHHTDGFFSLLDGIAPAERRVSSVDEALQILEQSIRSIPERRREKMKADIRRWFAEGKPRHELLMEINRLVKSDFKGGSITHQELKEAIQFCLALFSAANRGGSDTAEGWSADANARR